MKKTILFITVLFFSIQLIAQEEVVKNKFILGGSFNFMSGKNYNMYFGQGALFIGDALTNSRKDSKSLGFSFSPVFGKEISDKWTFGLGFEYGVWSQEYSFRPYMFTV